MSLALVWAQSADRFIGAGGAMPWHLAEDLVHFRELTAGHPVIMGRATWDSLPERSRPLPGRDNIVLSRRVRDLPGAQVAPDVDSALAMVGDRDAWVIGGAQVYAAFLPLADRLEVTQVDLVVAGDTRAPNLDDDDDGWQVVDRDPGSGWHAAANGLRYRFLRFARSPGRFPGRSPAPSPAARGRRAERPDGDDAPA